MSLRTRLLTGMLGLCLAGLLAVGGGTYLALRSFLLGRVDQQLVAARRLVDGVVSAPAPSTGLLVSTRLLRNIAPPDTFVQLRSTVNHVLASVQIGPYDEPSPPPRLPAVLHPPPASSSTRSAASRFEVGAVRGTQRYRVQVSFLPGERGILLVAVPLDDVSDTLSRLVHVELMVAGIALALLALGAFVLLRAGLRPLERIAKTAAGIADGDLDVRVAPADAHTEIGRLGLALNGMLERLEDAFARRDRSDAQLRRFVAGASHELRTPLTSIRGYAALFRRGAQDNPQDLATSMARIESEATRMGILIDDMLLLARLDEERPLERRPVDLAQIALDAAQDARARDPDQPIDIRAPGPLIVIGDEQRLRQVAANLVANAQSHTPPGTPVHVSTALHEGQATLLVADEGQGIDPEDTEHVFERFYRGRSTAQRASGPVSGSGLGLAIVAAIMNAHHGTASVSSEPGEGATFEVTLPLASVESPAYVAVPAPVAASRS
ncbi:MAG: sensor histidine kinase [Solirubrobacteraceae bacterium]